MTVPAEDPSSAHEQQRIPDFFIVGHPKSGTTALYDVLKRHPQIYMPHAKEPWFLATEMQARASLRPPGTGRTPTTLEEYLALFEAAGEEQRVGEASALYLWSQTAAGRIAELQPDARIIAVLREPASFLRSLHFQFVQSYVETETDLRKAISLEQARREGRHVPVDPYWPRATLYSEWVRYVDQLRAYHAHFGTERVLVLTYEDFRGDNKATVRRILRFLDVDDTAPITVRERNPTVRVRYRRVHELVHAVAAGQGPVTRGLRAAIAALTPRQLTRESAVAIRDRIFFAKPQPPDDGLMLELRRRFEPEVVAVSDYLARDLVSLWGYDGLH
jgi:hypothetical protein